jgi:4-hydroxybenzoate polyprenyltransferase
VAVLERFRASLTIYTATWLILIGGAVLEAVLILNGIARWPELFVLGVSGFQTSLILLFYMHLRDEPTSIKAMPVATLLLLVALLASAITSVLACTPYVSG